MLAETKNRSGEKVIDFIMKGSLQKQAEQPKTKAMLEEEKMHLEDEKGSEDAAHEGGDAEADWESLLLYPSLYLFYNIYIYFK